MNKNIKLAVAGAILATASVANAGIIIPAGEWTLDIGGNVNMYSSWSKAKGRNTIVGSPMAAATASEDSKTKNGMGNGLLPNFISVSGSTRQNDLDVGFTISLQPGSANNSALSQVGATPAVTAAAGAVNGGLNNRQSFITFGDKSWGSVKVGKDLGIFASDAILSDITLLGVGGAVAGGGNTSLGRIGFGYMYADWKPQIAYTTPNMNGFQATAGITQAFIASGGAAGTTFSSPTNASVGYEGKASYSFNANGVDGKVWVSGIAQRVGSFGATGNDDTVAYAGDIGAKASVAGFDVVGYYYGGSGIGLEGQFMNGYGVNAAGKLEARDANGGYVQIAYTLPTKTKVAYSWGGSYLDKTGTSDVATLVDSNEMHNLMVIHPLTKHLNLVGEYSFQQAQAHSGVQNEANVGSLGAILFF